MSEAVIILAAIAAVAAIAALIMVLRGQQGRNADTDQKDSEVAARADALARAQTEVAQAQTEIVGRLKTLAETQAAAQAALTKTLNDRLDTVSKGVGERLQAGAEKTAQSLGDLKKHLNVIDQAQKNIVELSQQVVGLQDLLANKQSRGAFGEHQLTDLVKNILPPSAYKIQATMSNGKRADCLILLPNPPGDIAVDAKFPLEGYRALRNAKSDQEKKDASRQFRTDLQKHIQDISEKYILPGETAESALMFLPAEAVYAEIHANFPEIVDASYRAHVWIVSPTTLMATLTTVRAILKDARMAEQTQVIQKEIHTLLKDVIRLDDRVGNLRRHFTHAESDIKEIQTSSEKISRRGERIEDMQIEDVDVAAVEQVTGAAPLPSTDETPTLPLEPLN